MATRAPAGRPAPPPRSPTAYPCPLGNRLVPQPWRDAWRLLACAHDRVAAAVEDAFRREGLPGGSWFEALGGLVRSPGGALRMGELQAEVRSVGQAGLTRLVDRMEEAGHVLRQRPAADRRAVVVRVTDGGRAVHGRMAILQAEAIVDAFAAVLPAAAAEQVLAALAPLAATTPVRRPSTPS